MDLIALFCDIENELLETEAVLYRAVEQVKLIEERIAFIRTHLSSRDQEYRRILVVQLNTLSSVQQSFLGEATKKTFLVIELEKQLIDLRKQIDLFS